MNMKNVYFYIHLHFLNNYNIGTMFNGFRGNCKDVKVFESRVQNL